MSDKKEVLPPEIDRTEAQDPFEQLAHAVNCFDSIASSIKAIAICYVTKNRETLEEKDAKEIRELLDL